MASFWAYSKQLSAVYSTLKSNPLYILKPVSTWKDSDPLYFTLLLLIILTTYTYYKTKTCNNCSYVQRLWSIAPIIYSGAMTVHHYTQNNTLNERLTLIYLLIFGWGSRFIYNLNVKGGYKTGKEDYRWSTIRSQWFQAKDFQWELFILFFVNIYQMISIYLFTVLPLYIVYYGPITMQLYDLPITIVWSLFLMIQATSDHDMYIFQEGKTQHIRKREFKQTGDEYSDGFFKEGMYKFSRHPNYFAELGQWWCIYLLCCIGNNKSFMFNWSCIGIINLSVFIYKWVNFTENITNFKYPKYKIYARRTSQFIPWPSKPDKIKKEQ